MVQKYENEFDVIVIGAGHAGCEAALSAARMGMKTLVLTIDLDHVAFMPCNPSIGGPAKGHIVREIDALGGEMGRNIDATMIQIRMLNTRKGPAVQALRAQADKKKYHLRMKRVMEEERNLLLRQGVVASLLVGDSGVKGVMTEGGVKYKSKRVILTSGTFLRSHIVIGEKVFDAGPNLQYPARHLSRNLEELGVLLKRFMTTTPPRVLGLSLAYEDLVVQTGDSRPLFFSFTNQEKGAISEQVVCYLTYSEERTHAIIAENLKRTPFTSNEQKSRGPRYCPSIEDKVIRFPEKKKHQIFIEPEGTCTHEVYLSGLYTSMPEEVQLEFLKTIPGMENAELMRPGYGIEYDIVDPTQLHLTLETKVVPGLFTAGQVNGTSGYEEAAGQGILAGINAALSIKGEPPLILDRSQAFIGVLIDDLVTRGAEEPYRMLTSRSEYRLILRHDNADLRLTPIGYRVGLIDKERWEQFNAKKTAIEETIEYLEKYDVHPTDTVNNILKKKNGSGLNKPATLKEILRRPELSFDDLSDLCPELPVIAVAAKEQVEIIVKYEGYIKRQEQEIQTFRKMEKKAIPKDIDYGSLKNLSSEAREKLAYHRPYSVGQASRIYGVTPADITALFIYLEQSKKKTKEKGGEG